MTATLIIEPAFSYLWTPATSIADVRRSRP